MSQVTHRVTPSLTKPPRVPPLQNGDHLTRDEFERRCDATPGLNKVELIEGMVYVAPPVSYGGHSRPHAHLTTLLGVYCGSTPGLLIGDNGSIRLDLDNMPQPDIFLLIPPHLGGQAKIDADDFITGAPELIAEIAGTTASFDLHDKLRAYCRNGAREYIVWRTLDGELDYFVLRQGDYQRMSPRKDGIFCSEAFPGLWLDAPALFKGDLAQALKTVQKGLASSEHSAFVASLGQRTTAPRSVKKK